MKTVANINRDDILTIAEFRKLMGPTAPSHNAIRKAIGRGKLRKLPDLTPDGHVQLLGGDFLDYITFGGFKQVTTTANRTPGVAASPEPDDTAPIAATIETSSLTVANETRPNSVLVEAVPVEIESGEATTSELKEVEQLVIGLPNFTEEDIIKALGLCSNRVKMCAKEAWDVGIRALIFAWACGTMLNKVKADCRHGEFSQWIKGHLDPLGLSSRTCQRYMKLARAWPRLGDLVESQPGLKKAYEASGIIQGFDSPIIDVEESGGEDTGQASENPRPAKPLLAFVINLKKRLNQGASTGEILTPEDLNQLGGVIDELTRFYKQHQQ